MINLDLEEQAKNELAYEQEVRVVAAIKTNLRLIEELNDRIAERRSRIKALKEGSAKPEYDRAYTNAAGSQQEWV